MSEVHGVWEVDVVHEILLGIFGVYLGGWLERKESKTPARSLAGDERHTWIKDKRMKEYDMHDDGNDCL